MTSRTFRSAMVMTLCLSIFASGCKHGSKDVTYIGDADLNYYRNSATQIAYPTVCQETPPQIQVTQPPRTLEARQKDEVWDLTLQETIQLALKNSEIIKSSGQFLNAGNSLYANPVNTPSVFDPAIQETNILFGSRGVEAALSDFDATWAVSTFYGRNETYQNQLFNAPPNRILDNQTGSFDTSLTKPLAYGASVSVNHGVDYLDTNSPGVLFGTNYTTTAGVTYRQQLLAGSGADYVRVAGPANQASGLGAITGVGQGVLIARINQDISLADFETNVRDLLRDVETSYWNLYLAYRNFDTAVRARNTSLQTWRIAKSKRDAGGLQGFSNWQEAQARDRYFETKAQAESSLSQIYQGEQSLRNLLQLAVNDGKIIRPVDEPVTVNLKPDWYLSLAEALTERVELRRQKWNIKSNELQLAAARNIARPRLDMVAGYNYNGFGDQLFAGDGADVAGTAQNLNSAYGTLTRGDATGFTAGLEYTHTLGLRSAKTQVRNLELRLVKSRKVLAAQELEISHELAVAFQELSRAYATAKSNFSRRHAAMERAQLLGEEYAAGANLGQGEGVIDRYLRAQESLANAEISYFSSLVDYNIALVDFQFRKGTLLQHDSVELLEGQWVPEAYQQALARAWARSHAIDLESTDASPAPFASSQPVTNGVTFINEVMPVENGQGSKVIETPDVPAAQPDSAVSPTKSEASASPFGSSKAIDEPAFESSNDVSQKSIRPEDTSDLRENRITTLAEWYEDQDSYLEKKVNQISYEQPARSPSPMPAQSPQPVAIPPATPVFGNGARQIGEALKSALNG
jgi:hypothetical protein